MIYQLTVIMKKMRVGWHWCISLKPVRVKWDTYVTHCMVESRNIVCLYSSGWR